jgi:rare lipoprotein A (peptidoglycan hydrolase)
MKAKACAVTLAGWTAAATLASGFGLHPSDPACHDKDVPPQRTRASARVTEVYAVWYDVPRESLARRRAGQTELTAAHNRLPIGALVRVTNIKNDKSVVVRITDRGITNNRAKIDICKEAAIELGMLRQGITRVRIEVLPDTPAKTSAPVAAAVHSIAP